MLLLLLLLKSWLRGSKGCVINDLWTGKCENAKVNGIEVVLEFVHELGEKMA